MTALLAKSKRQTRTGVRPKCDRQAAIHLNFCLGRIVQQTRLRSTAETPRIYAKLADEGDLKNRLCQFSEERFQNPAT